MNLVEVHNKQTQKYFLQVSNFLNKDLPNYVRPLNNDIEDIFDKTKNKSFKNGDIIRWVLMNDNNELIGRIAAFTNDKYINRGTEFITGGIGFFECVNCQAAANLLFDAAKNWLQKNNCAAMDGPINFGDRDKFWGLLVEGFNKEPLYNMPFNHPYYQQLFEGYGFKNYYNQYWYTCILSNPLPERFKERFDKFSTKKDYTAKHLNKKQIEKFAQDFAIIYNKAWAQHAENKEITNEAAIKLFNKMKPIIDERVAWFAYYKDEPIAMFICIPDLNQFIKNFNGKFGLLQKAQLLFKKKTIKYQTLFGLIFGVVPKYQSMGVDSFLIQSVHNLIRDKDWYKTIEMGWAGDWNPRMINIYKSLNGEQSRKMITYRFVFDEDKTPFDRHPIMEYK